MSHQSSKKLQLKNGFFGLKHFDTRNPRPNVCQWLIFLVAQNIIIEPYGDSHNMERSALEKCT